MAERVKARVGDTVETSFNLVYKKAEVARLPDHEQYEAIDFLMECDSDGKAFWGAATHPGEFAHIVCPVRDVTQDDQAITAQWHFTVAKKEDPNFFKAGEVWLLYLNYIPKEGESGMDTKSPRAHLLAEVELVADSPPGKA